jgi:hypothetical protein
MHKEFVPPSQTMNGKFCYDVLRLLMENIRSKHSVMWCNNSLALQHYMAPDMSLLVWQLLASTKMTVTPHLPYSPDLAPPSIFPIFENEIDAQGVRV